MLAKNICCDLETQHFNAHLNISTKNSAVLADGFGIRCDKPA